MMRRIATGVVWLFAAFNIFVLVWMLTTSLRPHKEIFGNPWGLPVPPMWENYVEAFSAGNFGPAAINTLLLVASSSLVIVIVSAPAAYVLSRTPGRAPSALTVLFAMGMGVPTQVVVIPLFVLMEQLDLVNSLFGVFVLYVALSLPFTVFLLTGFFRSLPVEIEEAAALDGAGPLRTYWRIMLPLARSGIITALILNAIGLWNETFIALVFIQSQDKQTLSLALLDFLSTQQYSGADYGALLAGVSILVLPMLGLYVWLGRRIIEGMTFGAGK